MPERQPSTFGDVLSRMLAILRAHWATLLPAGLILFVPIGLLETLDADLQETLGDADDLRSTLEVLAVALLHVAGALLGQIVFAGLISAVATDETPTRSPGLIALARELPLGPLALADLAFVLVVTVGFAALFVPGLLFLVWFALIGPVLEVERVGVRAAFGRSRALVRRRFWLVAAFVLPITLAEGALGELIHSASTWSLGENFLGEWAAGAATTLVISTIVALAVSVLYLELSAEEGAPPG